MINKYPDKSSYAVVDNLNVTEPTIRVNTYEDLWHLNQIVDAYNNQGITPTVTIPCLIDAQADRRFASNQSSGLKLVCKLLNGMDARFKIYHPHNTEVLEALLDNAIVVDNSGFIKKVMEVIPTKFTTLVEENLAMLTPDAGAYKWVNKTMDKIGWEGEIWSASKVRDLTIKDGRKMKQQLPMLDFGGKDVLIVDDISIYGGTFKGLSKLLDEANVGKKYLAVSHMTVQDLGKDPVTNYFDKVYTTNSKYEEYYGFKEEEVYNGPEGVGSPKIVETRFYPNNLQIIKMF